MARKFPRLERDTDVKITAHEGAMVPSYGTALYGAVLKLPKSVAVKLVRSAPHRFEIVEPPIVQKSKKSAEDK